MTAAPPPPTLEQAQAARERAEQEAEERGVSIDQICIAVNPFTGEQHVFVLGDE